MRRRNESWIQDKFIQTGGIEAFMPGVVGALLEFGYKISDVRKASNLMKCAKAMSYAWERAGKRQEQIAREAEEKGYYVTAGEAYLRAALYYGRGQWSITEEENQRKIELHAKCIMCYKKMAEYCEYKIERVEIPVGDKFIVGNLHLPNTEEKVPAILFCPGMDMIKEEYPYPFNNHALKRGAAVLSIDGPGQGESNIRNIKVTLKNYDEAGKSAVNYLVSRPEIDADRLGIFGVSMGSYWAPRIAAIDDRLKGCVAALGCYLSKDLIFKCAQPGFRKNYMYMSGIYNDDEFDEMAEQMTLENIAPNIKIPTLLSVGEWDELNPIEHSKKFFELLGGPKELWVWEDEFHPCGGVAHEAYPAAIDWLLAAVNGKIDPNLKEDKFIKTNI